MHLASNTVTSLVLIVPQLAWPMGFWAKTKRISSDWFSDV